MITSPTASTPLGNQPLDRSAASPCGWRSYGLGFHLQNVISSVCGGSIPCVEAWDTAEALYVRFESRAAAEEHESTVSDGFRSNYIVMDFTGKTSVTKSQQLWAMQHLAGTWQDYEGDFPDR